MHESSFMSPQTIQEEMFQERLRHHLKQQQSLQRQMHLDPALEQLLHSRFIQRPPHPEEDEILEALQAKHNQQLILRLQQEQQFQQLQEERHHLGRNGPGRHWAQLDRLVQGGSNQNRPSLTMQQAMYEQRLQGLGLQDQFVSNLNAVRPNQFSQPPEPDLPFQMRLEGERMRRNLRANPGPEDPSLWATGKDEKSARLLMGLLGNKDVVNNTRDSVSQGIRDPNWAFAGPVTDSYNMVPDGQTSGIEGSNLFKYQSMSGELLEDSGVNFFDMKDGVKSKPSWSNVQSSPRVVGNISDGTTFFNLDLFFISDVMSEQEETWGFTTWK